MATNEPDTNEPGADTNEPDTNEPEAKASVDGSDYKLLIQDMNGDALFEIDRAEVPTVPALKEEIDRRLDMPVEVQSLIVGDRVLTNGDDLADVSGGILLVEVPSPPVERDLIGDRQSVDHWKEIGSMSARGSVNGFSIKCRWQDQGWGNRKGQIRVVLLKGKDKEVGEIEDCFGICERRNGLYEVSKEFTPESSKVVRETGSRDTWRFEYKVGGGGGHTLEIRDFRAEALGSA